MIFNIFSILSNVLFVSIYFSGFKKFFSGFSKCPVFPTINFFQISHDRSPNMVAIKTCSRGPMGVILAPRANKTFINRSLGHPVGPSWGHVGTTLGRVRAKLKQSWAKLDQIWRKLGTSWAQVGPSRTKLGPSWGQVRGQVAPSWGQLELKMPSKRTSKASFAKN